MLRSRWSLVAVAPLVAACALALAVRARLAQAVAWPALPGEVVWSLLAVGDTGEEPWPFARRLQTHVRVGHALGREDVRAPVAALVLLGDLFYPDGLRARELEQRVRANLVEPLCRFASPSPFPDVACPVPPRSARVLAVLGNHDHHAAESPPLQRREIPRLLPSFHLPAGPVQAFELGAGVSLVLYDPKELLDAGDLEPLRAAVRATAGPWRILASHYPLTERRRDRSGRAAAAALAGLDVPIHLHLAGHRHYLELARTATPPFLQAIAGSGSTTRVLKEPLAGSVYQAMRPGFARVDLIREPAGDRLVVSLVALPDAFLAVWQGPRVVARWSVDRAGGARAEPLPAQ